MSGVYIALLLFFVVFISVFFFILYSLLNCISNPRVRNLLPIVCGIILLILIIVIPQPNPEPPTFLYYLKPLSPILLLPFFILAPLPFIEKKTGTVFGTLSLFFGAAITTVYFFVISRNGVYLLTGQRVAGGPEWTLTSVVLSSLFFIGIYLVQRYFSDITETKPEKPGTIRNGLSLGIGTKKIIIVAVWLFVLISPFFTLDFLSQPSSCGGFSLYRIDHSRPPDDTIIHLTDKDLTKYPNLKSAMKNPHVYRENYTITINDTLTTVTDLGSVQISCNEGREKYWSLTNSYSSEIYLEYEGKIYYAGPVWVH